MSAFGEDAYQAMLENFSASMPKPKAILILSSHTVSDEKIHILKTKHNQIQHDFIGFPRELYQIDYACPGDTDLAETAAKLFREVGFETRLDENAPLSHGVWIPLSHLYPKGDVPVVRVSLPLNLIPAQILKMGHAVSKLREQGVMIISTGGAVHNLKEMKWSKKNGDGALWAIQFEEFIVQSLLHKNVEGLLAIDEHPDFEKAHPTIEHFLPILFAVGSALQGDKVEILFRGIEYDSLSMLSFSLNHEQKTPLH